MIKTIIAAGIILSLIGIFFTGEILFFLVQFKASILYYLAIVFSRLSLTIVMMEVVWSFAFKFIKRI